jgi:V/A-type H+-transporting ATPase subunit F
VAEYRDRIFVIGDSSLVTGFKLAGVDNFALTESDADAEKRLADALSDPSLGIVIVSERVIEACDWRLKKKVEATAKPVVVAIPDRRGPSGGETESLNALIKRALGFDISKR